MSEEDRKKILSRKLNYYMTINGKNQMDLMKDLHLSSSTVSSWCTGQKMPRMGKLEMLANYLHVSVSDLIEESPEDKKNGYYYLNPETAKIAQQVFDDPDLKVLFDAAKGSKPEDIRMAAEMLKKFKGTNPDG